MSTDPKVAALAEALTNGLRARGLRWRPVGAGREARCRLALALVWYMGVVATSPRSGIAWADRRPPCGPTPAMPRGPLCPAKGRMRPGTSQRPR